MQFPSNCLGQIRVRVKVIVFAFMSLCFLMFFRIVSIKNASLTLPDFASISNNISCHYAVEGDALISTENKRFSPTSKSIFFHETSCKGGLNSRQACGVESAARAHPTWQIYVLFSGPVSIEMLEQSNLAKLQEYENVNFARVHIQSYGKGTLLENLLGNNPFGNSGWPLEHSSDVLRALTLYKYGGIYMDTDILVVKSLVPLGKNWAGSESNDLVSNGIISLSDDAVGRKVAEIYIKELNKTYNPGYWSYNGPGAITRSLEKFCNVSGSIEWTSLRCEGIHIYGAKYVYPVYYQNNDDYFVVGKVIGGLEEAYTHHMWNKLTKDKKIERGSLYDSLAKEYCPKIYQMYGDQFGN